MRMQKLAENYYAALPLALICLFLPILNWFALTWAVFTILRQSTLVGLIILGIIGFACYFIVSGFHFQGSFEEWSAIVMFWSPLWVMAYSLRRWRSLSLSLQLGFLLIGLVALIYYGVNGPLSYDELYQFFTNRLSLEPQTGSLVKTLQRLYIEVMASALILAWPATLLLLDVLLLLFARYFQSRWYYPGGFQMEFHNLRLARVMIVPLLLCFLWAVFAPHIQVAVQLAGMSALLFSIAGLAWLHWYIKARQLGKLWLVLIYAIIFAFSAWVLPVLVLMGMLDSQLDLRKRLTK